MSMARRLQLAAVRLVIANIGVDYAGRLSAHLPPALRLRLAHSIPIASKNDQVMAWASSELSLIETPDSCHSAYRRDQSRQTLN
jgi:hypothetical protein